MINTEMLAETRKRKGLTMSQVAKLSGVSLSSICKYEKGERTPTIKRLHALSKALGLKISELLI